MMFPSGRPLSYPVNLEIVKNLKDSQRLYLAKLCPTLRRAIRQLPLTIASLTVHSRSTRIQFDASTSVFLTNRDGQLQVGWNGQLVPHPGRSIAEFIAFYLNRPDVKVTSYTDMTGSLSALDGVGGKLRVGTFRGLRLDGVQSMLERVHADEYTFEVVYSSEMVRIVLEKFRESHCTFRLKCLHEFAILMEDIRTYLNSEDVVLLEDTSYQRLTTHWTLPDFKLEVSSEFLDITIKLAKEKRIRRTSI